MIFTSLRKWLTGQSSRASRSPSKPARKRWNVVLSIDRLEDRVVPAGQWTAVTPLFSHAVEGTGTMLLLTDGSVMVNGGGGGASKDWFRLTPDSAGNYA